MLGFASAIQIDVPDLGRFFARPTYVSCQELLGFDLLLMYTLRSISFVYKSRQGHLLRYSTGGTSSLSKSRGIIANTVFNLLLPSKYSISE